MNSKILDLNQFPLSGVQLIEASAGTGKTYTIAGLYLRLILADIPSEPLLQGDRIRLPDQILVVTFTRAAAEELRGRIRRKLVDARRAFSQQSQGECYQGGDELIRSLCQRVASEADAENQFRRLISHLQVAERLMDDAAISTIHSFCYRMLTRFAFSSGSLFENQLVQDHQTLLHQVACDYWRQQYYPLSVEALSLVSQVFSSPEQMLSALGKYFQSDTQMLAQDGTPVQVEDDLRALLNEDLELRQKAKDQLAKVRQLWRDQWDELHQDLAKAIGDKDLDGRSYKPIHLEEFRNWVFSEEYLTIPLLANSMPRFGADRLTDKLKKNKSLRLSKAHYRLDDLFDLMQEARVLNCETALLEHARIHCAKLFQQEKLKRAELGNDDLLQQLEQALHHPEQGDRLAAIIRQHFPVAMIDEFQDTDPLQYRIFRKLYHQQADTGFAMIGDPKQAIYSFRGGDIYTYMSARRDADNHYILPKNYRSSEKMVAHCNQLFLQAAERAFGPLPSLQLAYPAVSANGRSEWFVSEGEEDQDGLHFWPLPDEGKKSPSKENLNRELAALTARHIANLLKPDSSSGFYNPEDATRRPVVAADIAVLVRKGSQAKMVREALQAEGVRSVYLSNREAVFASAEAKDLCYLLAGVLDAERDKPMRTALATSLVSLPLTELERLNGDEQYWQQTLEYFDQLRLVWQWQGVLPMLHQLMHRYQIPERLLADKQQGERRLTNLLQLCELLQSASVTLEGMHALLHWLQQAIADPGQDEAVLQRLESDQALVKVVTIHKSKGLEYPLVYLPFASELTTPGIWRNRAVPFEFYNEELAVKQLYSSCEPCDERTERLEIATQQQLAEDLRLLYVAITRARHACFIGVAPYKGGLNSALGYLLAEGSDNPDLSQYAELLTVLAASHRCDPLPDLEQPLDASGLDQAEVELSAARFTGRIDRSWWVASYSSLLERVKQSAEGDALTEGPKEQPELTDEQPSTERRVQSDHPLLGFPRGARYGTFLHGLLEQLPFHQVNSSDPLVQAQAEEEYRHFVERRCQNAGLEEHSAQLHHWLWHEFTTTELDPSNPGFTLAALQPLGYQPELEFWISCNSHLNSEKIDQLLVEQEHPTAGFSELKVPTLAANRLHGMLKGFIDLVCEYQGRYYVVDYKSNHLGDQLEDYHPSELSQAMLEHRYDLQYLLYTLALHRLLKQRLGDRYDYQTHMGGALYLFLRGIQPGSQRGIFLRKPEQSVVEALDQLFQ